MTSPTATARPWATPVRAPRRDPAKKTRSRTGTAGPGLRDAPAEGGSVSQISASARHRRPAKASDLRPGCRSGRGRFARGEALGGASGGGTSISQPIRGLKPVAGRRETVQCRRRCSASARAPRRDRARDPLCSPMPPALQRVRRAGRPAGPSARRRPGAVSSGRPDSVCNPVVSAAAFGRRPGRSPARSTGSRDAADRRPGWTRRSARRASGAVCETDHPNPKGTRPPGRRAPRVGGRRAPAGSRTGRFHWQLFDAGVLASVPPPVRRRRRVELPRFRGHLLLLGGRGIRDAEIETAVCGGVPPADGRAGPVGAHAGGSGAGVRAVGPGHPELGGAGRPGRRRAHRRPAHRGA